MRKHMRWAALSDLRSLSSRAMAASPRPSESDAFRFWLKLGCISFGGPAGQIAIMHDELVGSDLISLMNANTDLLVEVERSDQGGAALLVALPGIGIGDEGLDRLLAATEHVVGLF